MIKVRILKGLVHCGVRLFSLITISNYILEQGASSFLPLLNHSLLDLIH